MEEQTGQRFEANIVTRQTVSRAKRFRKRLTRLATIFPRLLPRPTQILFEVLLCLFAPSPCSPWLSFSRIRIVLTESSSRDAKSSLGHVTGCKENALQLPLICSHNDGFRPNNGHARVRYVLFEGIRPVAEKLRKSGPQKTGYLVVCSRMERRRGKKEKKERRKERKKS